MGAEGAYRVVFVGSDDDLARLRSPLAGSAERFELELGQAGEEGLLAPDRIASRSPDVAVIGATVERPLPVARQLRAISPSAQIIFLLPADRLERFRATLPFVPNLASAWTANAADSSGIGALVGDAARASRKRARVRVVLGRINQQLAGKAHAPEQVRGSQLALSERYLATILTQSPDALLAVEPQGAVIAYNDASVGLFGPALELPRAAAPDLFPEEERERLADLLARAAGGETIFGAEVRLESAGDGRTHAELSLAPVHDDAGAIASVSITARDITERKRAEERQRLLINELNHRVKNTLAIVQGLAQQSFKGAAPPAAERQAFAARLAALASAHNLLTQQSWQAVGLKEIAEASVEAAGGAQPERRTISGPDVVLPPQTAVSVAMTLHELCTNAIKYGALSTANGRVSLRWDVQRGRAGERLHLEWREQGGPRVEPPSRRGFGLRMIERGLASELDARVKVDFAPEGLVCTIDAPLPGLAGGKP